MRWPDWCISALHYYCGWLAYLLHFSGQPHIIPLYSLLLFRYGILPLFPLHLVYSDLLFTPMVFNLLHLYTIPLRAAFILPSPDVEAGVSFLQWPVVWPVVPRGSLLIVLTLLFLSFCSRAWFVITDFISHCWEALLYLMQSVDGVQAGGDAFYIWCIVVEVGC